MIKRILVCDICKKERILEDNENTEDVLKDINKITVKCANFGHFNNEEIHKTWYFCSDCEKKIFILHKQKNYEAMITGINFQEVNIE
jgi:hypothetical protein